VNHAAIVSARSFWVRLLAYRINDAAAISGLGRSSLYKLMNSGQLRSVLVAGRRLIPAEALRELMQGAA
jgi:hypothetical protein